MSILVAWRDRFLRQQDPAFRDLVSAWQTVPARSASSEESEPPGLELGLPVLSVVAHPEAPGRVAPAPPDPPPRVPVSSASGG